MDAVLRELMNITEAQAEGDAEKIKAMRTCVGWFSSPVCALIYQVAAPPSPALLLSHTPYLSHPRHTSSHPLTNHLPSPKVAKYVAMCSTKGYAIGRKFLEWIEARLADVDDQSELLGHSEDILAICGSR
eukprot:7130340-Prymnesium_polylepis.1